MKNAQHAPNTETIILATRHADGATTRNPHAAELIDAALSDAEVARLVKRLRGVPETPIGAAANCLHCSGDNPSDLPVCAACIEKGITPAYKFARCLICEKRLRVGWDEQLPLTCGNHGCVTKIAQVSQALGRV